MPRGVWTYTGVRSGTKPKLDEKREIIAACEKLIEDVLKPRYLPKITRTKFNYPIALFGKWHGNKYRFVTRYRSGFTDNLGEEFEVPFARLEFVKSGHFDLSYYRHTGEWYRLDTHLSLAKALKTIAAGGHFAPPI